MPAEPASEPRVAFVTLGCPKNEVDSDRMEAAVTESGLSITTELDEADVVVVNTCAFIQAATEESIETVLGLATDWASEREGRHLVATGCMVSRYGKDLAEAMPEALTHSGMPVNWPSTTTSIGPSGQVESAVDPCE